jgi:hypothetical protein
MELLTVDLHPHDNAAPDPPTGSFDAVFAAYALYSWVKGTRPVRYFPEGQSPVAAAKPGRGLGDNLLISLGRDSARCRNDIFDRLYSGVAFIQLNDFTGRKGISTYSAVTE